MPLVLLCGQPCSGKSTLAARLAQEFAKAGCDVVVVDEPSLHIDKNLAYKDSASEKMTRGQLKSAAERALTCNRAVILDSLNAIKGFRYELWCVARAAATRFCVMHPALPLDVARVWNDGRRGGGDGGRGDGGDAVNGRDAVNGAAAAGQAAAAAAAGEAAAGEAAGVSGAAAAGEQGAAAAQPGGIRGGEAASASGSNGVDRGLGGVAYAHEVFEDLAGRFEAPDPRNRWDSPLFEVDPREADAVDRAVADAIASALGSSTAPAKRHAKQLVPTCATTNEPLSETNRLTELHAATRDVMRAVCDAQAAAGAGGAVAVVVVDFGGEGGSGSGGGSGGGGIPPLRLHRPVPLAELRAHKQAFLKIVARLMGGSAPDARTAKRMFVEYLQQQQI